MDLSYTKQVCLEVIKGGFILLGVVVGGGYLNQVMERFRRNQDVLADVTKRRYQALISLLEEIGKYDHAVTMLAAQLVLGNDEKMRPRRVRIVLASYQKAHAAVLAHQYLVGVDIAEKAHKFIEELAIQAHKSIFEDADRDVQLERVREARGALTNLLPSAWMVD
jgi:hypothetical protein